MKNCGPNDEPLCETSELGEKALSHDEILDASLGIGHRLLEIFGYQSISNVIFRLKSTSSEVRSVINGEKLPSVELLMALNKETGVSIDWILTGTGPRFRVSNLVQPAVSAQAGVVREAEQHAVLTLSR